MAHKAYKLAKWMRLLATALAVLLLGCGLSRNGVKEPESESTRFAVRFGQALAKADYAGAYEMLGKEMKAKMSQEGLRLRFANALWGSGESAAPIDVSVKTGRLPRDPIEARESYEMTTIPPMESWQEWVIVGFKGRSAGAQKVSAPMLIVRDDGQLKVGFVHLNP